jgi:hypothetical protein
MILVALAICADSHRRSAPWTASGAQRQAGCPAGVLCGERHISQPKALFEMAGRIIKAFPTLWHRIGYIELPD